MKNPFTRFESSLRKLGKSNKKLNHIHILSDIEVRPFQKRKKRILFSLLQKLDIKISKKHSLYYLGCVFIFFLGIIAVGVFGPYLQIARIEIVRDSSYIDINMAYSSVDNIRGRKIYSLDTKKIAENLIHFQNNIEIVKINVMFPNRVDIRLNSSPGILQTKLEGKSYVITKNGSFIPTTENQKLPFVFMYGPLNTKSESVDYKKILEPGLLKNIQLLLSGLQQNMLKIQIESIHYFVQEKEVFLEIQKGTYLIFDINRDIKPQLEKLVVFDKEKGYIEEKGYIYIDVRVTNKIFLCGSENEFDCRRNLKNIYGEIQKKP